MVIQEKSFHKQSMSIEIFGVIILGGIISPVLNRCIQRMPDDLPLSTESKCPSCNYSFSPISSLPIYGYIAHKHCPHCEETLSPQPILVDILAITATIAVLLWRPLSPQVVIDLVYIYALIVITMIDWNTMTIEPRVIVFIICFRIIWLGIFEQSFLFTAITGMLIGAGMFYFIAFFYETLRRRQGLGDGDAAVLGMIGLWVGWQGLGPVILVSSISGTIVGVIILLLTKQSLATTRIPFAPFLCLGGLSIYILQNMQSMLYGLSPFWTNILSILLLIK